MRILFYKPDLAWPRASGHDVHTYQMMRAMSKLGARVALATTRQPAPEAIADIALERLVNLDGEGDSGAPNVPLRWSEERFRSYWGVPLRRIAAFGKLANDFNAEAVVVSGLDVLPVLCAVKGRVRVWYAGDEWTWHHLSQVQLANVRSWLNLKDAVVKGLYERAFRARVDRAWAVSDADARSLRWIAGMARVDTLPNGIDADVFRSSGGNEEPDTAVFWGRLDFGPNIQALEWFVDRVWPLVRRARRTARLTIAGFRPGAEVHRLTRVDGIALQADVPDIRPIVDRHALVVLPFVSGGGIKNKLLEAAAMSKAIVATPKALRGLKGQAPIRLARTPRDWATAMVELWDDESARRGLGLRAREWVAAEHTWKAAAQSALHGIRESLDARGRR